jgi:formylglycine-generating enzyme required for sulfatase activity
VTAVSGGDPALGSGVDAQNPWPGLVAFTEELREFFHGRVEQAEDLLRRVNRENLTVLFGQSGLGKTSLLAAGLFPLLRVEGFLPVAIRLDHGPGAPGLSEQVRTAVNRALLDADARAEAALPDSGETLWEYFHRRGPSHETSDGPTARLVLVLDQFEELFAIGQANEEGRSRTALFLEQLADLIENRAPRVLVQRLKQDPKLVKQFDFEKDDHRVLISFREDYLPQLESLRQLMPSVGDNRVRLTRMNGLRALEAVNNPGGKLITPEVGRQVVRFVAGGEQRAPETDNGQSADDGLAGLEVEPSLLSLVCRELNNRRLAKGMPQITSDMLADNRESILHDFYERCIADQPRAVRAFVEDELVTDSGLRENIALERAQKTLIQWGAPAAAIDELVKRRLLRLEERLKIQRVELAHDVLTPVITKSRDQRQQQERLDRAEQQAQEAREKVRGQKKRMRLTVAAMTAALLIVSGIGMFIYFQNEQLRTERREHQRERTGRALDQVERLGTARALALPQILKNLEPYQREILPRLQTRWSQVDAKTPNEEQKKQRMRIGMALLPMKPLVVKEPLFTWMLEATDAREVFIARDALKPYAGEYNERLWRIVRNQTGDPRMQYRALVALASYAPRDERWQTIGEKVVEQPTIGEKVVEQLLREEDRLYLFTWLQALEPVRDALFDPLRKVFIGANRKLLDRRHVAATALEYFTRPGMGETTAVDIKEMFADLVLEADERQFAVFWQRVAEQQAAVTPKLLAELSKKPLENASEEQIDSLASRKANAAVTLVRLGLADDQVWRLLRHTEDPSLRTYIMHRLASYSVPVQVVVNRLLNGNPEVSERRALILSLGEYPLESLQQSPLSSERQKEFASTLENAYVNDPDPGIHSSVEWLLRQWKPEHKFKLDPGTVRRSPADGTGWIVNKQGQTMAIIPEVEKFMMGSKEPGYPEEPWHRTQIPRSYAIGTKEVTVAQFKEFLESSGAWMKHDKGETERLLKKYSPDPDGPMIQVDWFWAAAYCNWLSMLEGLPVCYPENIEKGTSMKMPPDFLKLKGYRLPTEAEWEYACRAGATASRFYGESSRMLEKYAWYAKTTGSVRTMRGGLKKPNDLGLFDVYGNVWEWCQDDAKASYPPGGAGLTVDEEHDHRALAGDTFRVLRGGAFLYPDTELRSGYRYWNLASTQIRTLGLRVVRTFP